MSSVLHRAHFVSCRRYSLVVSAVCVFFQTVGESVHCLKLFPKERFRFKFVKDVFYCGFMVNYTTFPVSKLKLHVGSYEFVYYHEIYLVDLLGLLLQSHTECRSAGFAFVCKKTVDTETV